MDDQPVFPPDWASRLQAGDTRFFTEHADLFLRWIRRALASRAWKLRAEDQKDVEQIALAALPGALRRFQGAHPVALREFVQQVAIHKAIQWVRSLARKQDPLVSYDAPDFFTDRIDFADQAPDAAVQITRQERAELVRESVAVLDERCREVIHRFYWDGRKYREIAEERGESINTIGTRLLACLRKFRAALEDRGDFTEYFSGDGDVSRRTSARPGGVGAPP